MTHRPLRNNDNSICSKQIGVLQQNVLSIRFVCEGRLEPNGCKVTAMANHPDVPSKSVPETVKYILLIKIAAPRLHGMGMAAAGDDGRTGGQTSPGHGM